MKNLAYIFFALTLLGCSSNKENDDKSDLIIDVKASGLDYTDVKLMLNNDTTSYESNTVNYTDQLKLVISGVKGFNSEGGRIFPGAHMTITDEKGNIVLEETDLFREYDSTGIEESKVDFLYVQMLAFTPLQPDKEYYWSTRFWDKRGEGQIITKVPVKIKGPNNVEVKVKTDKLQYWRAYLAGTNGIKTNPEFKAGDLMYVEVEQVRGIQFENDSNHMCFESKLIGTDGTDASETIYDTLKLKSISILEGYLHLSEKLAPGNYTWVSRFTDLIGKGFIETSVDIKVVK